MVHSGHPLSLLPERTMQSLFINIIVVIIASNMMMLMMMPLTGPSHVAVFPLPSVQRL